MHTTASLPPSLQPRLRPGTQIGHYRVESLLSSGGFGAVYRASRDGHPFALKLPLSDLGSMTDEQRQTLETRISREVASLVTLAHPSIVRVHGFDRWPDPKTGAVYLVMDLVEGVPLLDWRRNEHPTLREVVELFQTLAQAVDEMHKLGVIHRDIKSSNVLVAPEANRWGPAWKPVLVDFGLARPACTPAVTQEFMLVGTEGYWAPEHAAQLANPAFDAKRRRDRARNSPASEPGRFKFTAATDLHALGLLFYQALTGLRAFRSDSADFTAVVRELARPPSSLSPSIPECLDAPVLRLLAKNPEERTVSGSELAQELEALLASTDESWDRALPAVAPTRPDASGPTVRPPASAPTSPQRPRHRSPTLTAVKTSEGKLPATPIFAARVLDVAPALAPPTRSARVARPSLAKPPAPTSGRMREQRPGPLAVGVAACVALILGSGVGLLVSGRKPPRPAVLTLPTVDPAVAATTVTAVPTSSSVARTVPPPEARPPVLKPLQPPAVRSNPPPDGRKSSPVPTLVRAALLGRAQPGPVQAVLRQPVALAAGALPTGTAIDGTADELPDGRYLLHFDAVERSDGSTLALDATALVDAKAAERHPLRPGTAPPSFEFDLTLGATR